MGDGCFPGSQNRMMVVWMLLASIAGVIGTSNVPGVKMSQLEVWENSANPGVFGSEFADEYLHFRTYGLTALSDAGLFDHLLTAFGPNVLRVIDSGVDRRQGCWTVFVLTKTLMCCNGLFVWINATSQLQSKCKIGLDALLMHGNGTPPRISTSIWQLGNN